MSDQQEDKNKPRIVDDAPVWSWSRMIFNLPPEKGPIPFTRIGEQPESPDKPDWRGVIKNRVNEWPVPEEYKFRSHDPKYFFFDTPDYADPFKKLWYSFKWFTYSGILIGVTYYGIIRPKKCTLENNISMMNKIVIPWVAYGMAGAATVVTAANLRGKKDDQINYALAGFVFGSLLGRKNHNNWFMSNVVSIPAAMFIKYNAETNKSMTINYNYRVTNQGLAGHSAEHGITSGDLRFGIRATHGDPGRDTRKCY